MAVQIQRFHLLQDHTFKFLVSERKVISGQHFLLRSMSFWIVVVFPRPQQFQLKSTKEEDDERWENPKKISNELVV